jgi:hypothetical protein
VAVVYQEAACPSCHRSTSTNNTWWPYCSNECEQRAQVEAARAAPPAVTVVEVRQLDLENARPWEPQVFPIGTLEHYLGSVFEAHLKQRLPRRTLLDMARASVGRVNERNIAEAIRELRRGGWPIISSSGEEGYWLSWDPADLDMLEQTMRGRSLDMLRTLSRIRRARARVARVPVLDDVIDSMERGEL